MTLRPPSAFAPVALAIVLLLGGAAGQAQARPSATVRLTGCATSLQQPARFVAAEGAMRTLKGASRMQIRFELQSRTPDRPAWQTLAAPGFGVWNTADPSVRRYVYQKRVEALAAPADYRMVVQFRWLSGSRAVAQQRKVTRVCQQPDRRADLVPRRLTVKDGRAAFRYVVRIANSGSAASGPFSVVLIVNGVALPALALPSLEPGADSRAEVIGPPCVPGSSLAVRVDPAGRVDERDEAGNELVRSCPG